MHDPRTSTALRRLTDIGSESVPSPWRWSIVNLESTGRIVLPDHARQALARSPGDPEIRGRACRACRVACALRKGGAGAQTTIDGRGRVYLPAWLRSACAAGVLVGTRSGDGLVLVIRSVTGVPCG